MRRSLFALFVLACLVVPAAAQASPLHLSTTIGAHSVDLTWAPLSGPATVLRDGTRIGSVPAGTRSFSDRAVQPGTRYAYKVVTGGQSASAAP